MKPKRKLALRVLAAILLAVLAVSLWKLREIRSEYRRGEDAYDNISRMVSLPPASAAPRPSDSAAETEAPAEEDDTVWPEVDFDALREINPDIAAWIYIEGTEINYPVVQGEDNSFYLNRLFSGERNAAGCIFLDSRNDAGFTGRNSILYGHHMKNGTMFAGLDSYREQKFYDTHPTGLLVTPDRNYKIEFFSGYVAASYEDAWDTCFTDAEFEAWLQNAAGRSCFVSRTVPDVSDHVLTLSTCSYEFYDARFVLVGALR